VTIEQRIDRKLKYLDDLFGAETEAIAPLQWKPYKGKPQELAYYSPAQDLLYGGQPGGGKSELIIGLALTAHRRSLILRREASQLNEIVNRIEAELLDSEYKFHGKTSILKYGDHWVEKGGCKLIKDKVKYKGRTHDLKAFDELSEIPKEVYDYVKIWCRTTVEGQRCRTVATTNPPDTQDGQWIVRAWSPWLQKKNNPNPAQSGEIRWYLGDEEVDEGTKAARSRTFIYSSIEDNPILMATGYKDTLLALPEELRRTMMEGFDTDLSDTPYQVIPTAWVQAAIQRGRNLPLEPNQPIDAIACDPARGGKDDCAIATRKGYRITVTKFPPIQSQDGMQVVQHLINARCGQNPITMLDSIGIGASPFDIAKLQGLEVIAMDAGAKSYKRDRSGKLSFANRRAEWWWGMREDLDPNYNPQITLPDNPEVLADLTAPHWSLTMRGIQIELKADIKKRIGRSTNIGDAIVMVRDIPNVYTSSFL